MIVAVLSEVDERFHAHIEAHGFLVGFLRTCSRCASRSDEATGRSWGWSALVRERGWWGLCRLGRAGGSAAFGGWVLSPTAWMALAVAPGGRRRGGVAPGQ